MMVVLGDKNIVMILVEVSLEFDAVSLRWTWST